MAKYIIDTHILIWVLVNPHKINQNITNILINNHIFVSQISLLEISIKQSIGKLPDFEIPINVLINVLTQDGFNILGLKNKHIATYRSIPILEHHRDPFDRLLIATAITEKMAIISADANFEYYKNYIDLKNNK
jgi:PIN domain nuclease of toxin-antitoxin system